MRFVAASLEAPPGLHDFLVELGRGEGGFGGTDYNPGVEPIEAFLQRLVNYDQGVALPPGRVPSTTFWLLDDTEAVVGICRLRHALNDELLHHGGHIGYYIRPAARGKGYGTAILASALAAGRQRGIDAFLLTADVDNVASCRTIERNGGILEDERLNDETGRMFRRYWIR